jgi:signal transduction histidine kinase
MISSKLVKQFDGQFTIDSTPGVGSNFTFTFKLSKIDELDLKFET